MKSVLGLFLVSVLAAFPAFAAENSTSITTNAFDVEQPTKNRSNSGDLTFGMVGRKFDDAIVQARYVRSFIAVNALTKYQDWLEARLSAGYFYTTGASSALYSLTEVSAGLNQVLADEISLTFLPYTTNGFESHVSAGVLRADLNPISSVLWQGHWMGAAVNLDGLNNYGTLHFNATQTTPSSTSISNGIEDEGSLPLLTTGTLTGTVKILSSDWSFAAGDTAFVFTDPSSQAATDSAKSGSDTVQNGKAFTYDYRGNEVAAALIREAQGGDKLTIKGSALVNNLAPTGRNADHRATVEYLRAASKWNYTGAVTAFSTEADSIPASYASPYQGYTNRVGTMAVLKLENRKERFTLIAAYTHADVIDNIPTQGSIAGSQADRDIVSLGAEVKYDLF